MFVKRIEVQKTNVNILFELVWSSNEITCRQSSGKPLVQVQTSNLIPNGIAYALYKCVAGEMLIQRT